MGHFQRKFVAKIIKKPPNLVTLILELFILPQQSTNTRVEHDIIDWVNSKLETSGKESRIQTFQDPKISSAIPVIDLIDAIKPGVINYELLQEGGNYEVGNP